MIRYRAEWVLPMADEPLQHGWVAIDGGTIAEVGAGRSAKAIELGHAAILPALVNAHTHLELSYLHGRVPRATSFIEWVRPMLAMRRQFTDPHDPVILDAARHAIQAARESGTGVFGDVSNTLVTPPLLDAAGLSAHVFYELLGFNASDPTGMVAAARMRARAATPPGDRVRVSLAPHAPYSVSPALFTAIRADLDATHDEVSSVHLGESPQEIEFLKHGTGPWRTMLQEIKVWDDEWRVPDASPVGYLEDLGFLDSRVLAVHGVQFDGEDLSRLAALGVTVVSCPRSNEYVGVGAPPIEAFYAMDVDVAFGTDSLASAPDLNLFSELAEARTLAPRVPARRLLESATLSGARALRVDSRYGSIEPGKRAALIAVRLPESVSDVEEYLLSGIQPSQITWLDAL